MSTKVFKPSKEWSENTRISSIDQYNELYKKSIQDPDGFWAEQAERLDWIERWETVREYDFVKGEITWYKGGKLNVSYNCLDRHVEAGYGDRTALLWEGNDPSESRHISYRELLNDVQKFANVLKANGVKKGDRVCLYMQMIPQLPVAMLACARNR